MKERGRCVRLCCVTSDDVQDVNKQKTCPCLLTSRVSTEASSEWRHVLVLLYAVYCVQLDILRGYSYSVDFAWMKCQQCRQLISESKCSVCAICYERPAGHGWSGLTCLAITFPAAAAAANFAGDLETTFSESHGFWMSSNLVSLVFR